MDSCSNSEYSSDADDKTLSEESGDGIITKEMVIEEEKLRLEADKELEKLHQKLETNEHNKEIEQKKVQRLMSLLENCQFYSGFASKKLAELKGLEIRTPNKVSRKRKHDEDCSSNPSSSKKARANGNFQKNDSKTENEAIIQEKTQKEEESSCKENGGLKFNVKESEINVEETRLTSLGINVPVSQPKLLIGGALRDYQLEGLNWLKMLFLGGMNGILADEMGLGKTVQIISLICHLYEEKVGGPFLVIGPLSTLPNWIQEFERFAPDLPVVLYHGEKKTRENLRKAVKKTHQVLGYPSKPVVITSYEVPLMDKHFLKTINWKYIIVDEGHRLKNHNTLLARTLKQFRSVNRMLLTGTPLQNNLYELWSLLHFLMPELFKDLNDFQAWFAPEEMEQLKSHDSILQKERENHVISTLHSILEPFLLRRIKADVNLNLPIKIEKQIFCPLTEIQYKLYSQSVDKTIFRLSQNYDPDKENLIVPNNSDGSKSKRRCTQKPISYKDMQKDEDLIFKRIVNGSTDEKLTSVQTEEKNYNESESIWEIGEGDGCKIRLTMNSVMMMLRKISNHPYLVRKLVYPGSDILKVDERLITSSGKMMVLNSLLERLKKDNHKVLIFSTFTSLLDLIEAYLDMKDYSYVRLDGSTKIEQRKESIREFNTDPDLFVFLVSTRAGGLGINLTGADTVIIFDSDWNPQVDLQAQDRCHRIGQTKPVLVFRLITTGTVDEKIVNRASAKRKLEKVIIQAGEFKFQRATNKIQLQLDLESLKSMLDEKNCIEIHSNGSVLTDEQWDYLLDRTK